MSSVPLPLPDDNKWALRQVVRACPKACLSTLMAEDGAPYGSLVTVAIDHDLAPVLLLSGLSDHSRNIAADHRVSVLFDGTDGHANPQTGPRVTLMGRAERCADPRLRARFLARHPGAALYADFADFSLWRVVPERVHFVGGFGRAVWFSAPFGLSEPTNAAMVAAEPAILGQVVPMAEGEATVIGWDVDGVDLIRNDISFRIAFSAVAQNPEAARKSLESVLGQDPG